MSNTLVSQQLALPTLQESQSGLSDSVMSGLDSPMPDISEGSTEPFSSIPLTLPLSNMQGDYCMFATPEAQDALISCNLNGHSESRSNFMEMQQFALPSRETGEAQIVQPDLAQTKVALPTKRKAASELSPDNQGYRNMFVPNRKVAQVGSFPKAASTTSACIPNSPRPTASCRKVVQVESVMNKSHSTTSKKNAQPQVSPKAQTGADESVRAKLRESLASALALVSRQEKCSPDQKVMMETESAAVSQKGVGEHKPLVSGSSNEAPNQESQKDGEACTSSIPHQADGSNNVGDGNQTNKVCEEATETWNYMEPDFQYNPVLSGEDDSFKDGFTFKDDLLQGNGLSWVSDLYPEMPEMKQVEDTGKPELVHEGASHDVKEQTIQSPELVASQIESELFKLFGGVNKKYKEKGRSLLFNLKDRNNPELRERVMSGEIPPDRLCSMTAEELASKELSQWRIAKAEELDQMKVLPDSEVNMRRLVKKTHKGEYTVDLEPDIGTSEDIPLGTSLTHEKRPKVNAAAAPSLKAKKTKAAQDNCEISFPSDGADMQGLMVDDMRDLPPIVSLDEFMESLDKEPPFENLSDNCGKRTPESDKEHPELGSESKSPVQPSKVSMEVISQKINEVGEGTKPGGDVKSAESQKGLDTQTKPGGDVKSAESQKGLDTQVIRLPKGERVWEGLLQLNISSAASFVAFYKSGEKTSTREWPIFVEIKGRVKLDAFDKFVQALPMSRTRAVMTSHFVLKEESTDTDRANLTEMVESYIVDQRVGFAEPAPGVELYLCPPRVRAVDVIINHLPKSYTEKLNDIDNGLIGIIVWRKAQITPSAISPNSSSHHTDMTNKHPFATGSKNAEHNMNRNVGFASRPAPPPHVLSKPQPGDVVDDDDDVPPGFGPPVSRDDDDLPEFNFSGGSNAPISRVSDPKPHPGQGMRSGSGSRHPHLHASSRQVEQMRELVLKYGQNETKSGSGIPTQPWNDDDDDDIPEWQPQASHNEPPPQLPLPPHNPVLPPQHNQPPFQRPPWPPLAQPLQPLQPPMSIQQQAIWRSYGPNNVPSQPAGQFYPPTGHRGRDWRPNGPNSYRGY